MHPPRPFPALLLLALLAAPACAQEPTGETGETVIQRENVRIEYARVLRAEPVYQTLRATSMVERCEQSTPVARPEEEHRSGFARLIGAVKDAFTPDPDPADGGQGSGGRATDTQGKAGGEPREGCRMVPVNREFQRPIAYDVDYVHHGVKYRSRLPYDPGDRLRVRVSIMPIVAPAGNR